ncbi:hypothetical protein CO230_01585 [Chryseobacterium sp. 6424]|uniref:hypothetical protein n=1 Tax=Chryseobacterium sp. 6424 TaxID=2039166 RepID=UPI000EFA8E6D|nr:hypothetical protein [Chryseobacterium sp. 6424]AYO56933.1 hypothetical protein CO230_01585 [Chryseobacterium sp. 6424]
MARFDGIFGIEGTLKGMTFYKSKDGQMIRTKGGVSKERIHKDPAFERTRENGSEFAHCAKMAQLFRKSVSDKVELAKDHRTSSRLNKVMHDIKALDEVSPRGTRNVPTGLQHPDGPKALNGFEFNMNGQIAQVFLQLQALNAEEGTLNYPAFIPQKHLLYPEGATEADLQLIAVQVDFSEGTYTLTESPNVTVPKTPDPVDLQLAVSQIPGGTLPVFYLLLAAYYQVLNGTRYPLKNKQYNALGVIGYLLP